MINEVLYRPTALRDLDLERHTLERIYQNRRQTLDEIEQILPALVSLGLPDNPSIEVRSDRLGGYRIGTYEVGLAWVTPLIREPWVGRISVCATSLGTVEWRWYLRNIVQVTSPQHRATTEAQLCRGQDHAAPIPAELSAFVQQHAWAFVSP